MRIIRFISMTTYLIGPQRISLDTKVGYLLATYTLRSSLRNDCLVTERFTYVALSSNKRTTNL